MEGTARHTVQTPTPHRWQRAWVLQALTDAFFDFVVYAVIQALRAWDGGDCRRNLGGIMDALDFSFTATLNLDSFNVNSRSPAGCFVAGYPALKDWIPYFGW